MKLVLDAGALIAYERGSRFVAALLEGERAEQRAPITHGGIVGQVWRSPRQAQLARVLTGAHVVPLDTALGKRAGLLLAKAKRKDVLDAALVLLAVDGDTILTSDSGDLRPLAEAAGLHVDIVDV